MDAILRQLQYVEKTILSLFFKVDVHAWKIKKNDNIRSIFEICQHITTIPVADYLLSKSASHQEMEAFYKQHQLQKIEDMTSYFSQAMEQLYYQIIHMSFDEQYYATTSYWGVTYTKKEWILEILMHLTHHRAQLYFQLKEGGVPVSDIALFE